MTYTVEQTFKETIALITGLKEGCTPLGGITIEYGNSKTQNLIAGFFKHIIGHATSCENPELLDIYTNLKNDFLHYYSDEKNTRFIKERIKIMESATDDNTRARAVTEIWAPETAMVDDDILPTWKLSQVKANNNPYKPDEILIQLNGLYTLPENIPDSLPITIKDEWDR